jgi:hypothetical protein
MSRKQQLDQSHVILWLSAALLIPLYYGLISVHHGLQGPDRIHHDARLHIIWLQRFVDPQLFPGDYIADYFQDFAPRGFKALYWSAAQLGIEPLILAKYLPLPIAILTSIYCFELCLQIFPIPAGAFISVLILNQGLWLRDDVISATPRAFATLLFAAFLCCLLKRQLIPCLGIILLQGLFYPMLVLLEVGILMVRLCHIKGWLPKLSRDPIDYWFAGGGMAIAFLVLLPNLLNPPDYGPVMTAAQMQQMPEFHPQGRTPYFGVHPILFWTSGRSGIRIPIMPPSLCLAFLFPMVSRTKSSLATFITSKKAVLWHILLSALILYTLAHFVLLKLYFPSRYTYYAFRFILTIAASITITILVDIGLQWLVKKMKSTAVLTAKQMSVAIGLMFLCGSMVIVPALPLVFLGTHYWHVGKYPDLYHFIRQQPQDIMIATLSKEADNLPSLTQRSVLVSRNTAIAFHSGYYKTIQNRIIDLISAQYDLDLDRVKQFIKTYGIDFWLLDRQAFTPDYIAKNGWLMQFQPRAGEAIARLQAGGTPALVKQIEYCTVLKNDSLILLRADCILAQD